MMHAVLSNSRHPEYGQLTVPFPIPRGAYDDTVAALYGAPLARRTGWPLATFPAGEGSKSLEEYDRLCRRLVQLGLTRSDGILALGGGVTGDLAGFAAATLLRGVALVQAPTTLLAQVDSAVGGKTGLDLPEGKNLLGCFYQPRMVLADTVCLATLPWRQLACGMAEVIKYGCIWDADLFKNLEAHTSFENLKKDLTEVIYRCVDIKRIVVEHDQFDTGERMLLNFGHTLAHTIEQHYHYTRESHGEAVAIGMYQITKIAEEMGLLDRVLSNGWKSLSAKKKGRNGG